MGTRATIYCRISQDREGRGLGVERQRDDCRKLAQSLGLTVVGEYIDNDISAYSGKKRPGYLALLDHIAEGDIDAVLTWHPDRLHRSPLELEHYISLSEQHNVATHSVTAGRWDLSTPAGRYTARSIGNNARYESEHKSERIRAARVQSASQGKWHGGIRPYGFEKDGVTIRQSEAAEIVRAIDGIVSGQSLRSLVRDLNERSIPTATGKGPWTSIALRDTMMRPRVAGLSSHLGEIVGKAVWPALVPEETWRAVCAILSDPDRRTNRIGGTVRWIGSGLYLCGVCHQPTLRIGASGAKAHMYRCANRDIRNGGGHVSRNAQSLDAFVEDVLVAKLSDPRLIQRLTQPDNAPATTQALRVEQVAVRQRQDELAELHAAGDITSRQLVAGTKKLTERGDEIAAELARVGTRTPLQPLAGAEDVAPVWFGPGGPDGNREGGLPLGARRAILDMLLTVTVLPGARRVARHPRYGHLDLDAVDFVWKV